MEKQIGYWKKWNGVGLLVSILSVPGHFSSGFIANFDGKLKANT
jgi:hypothetical protein